LILEDAVERVKKLIVLALPKVMGHVTYFFAGHCPKLKSTCMAGQSHRLEANSGGKADRLGISHDRKRFHLVSSLNQL
jgi:hypothetical protein